MPFRFSVLRVGLLILLLPAALSARQGDFELRSVNGKVVCVATPGSEVGAESTRSAATPRTLNPHVNAVGTTIILRATTQMDAYPSAKAAFVRAAQTWEQYLLTPITVTVDVDFGPMRFGQPYSANTLGSTNAALTVEPYSLVSFALRGSSRYQQEVDLYANSPTPAVITDLGTTSLVVAPQALFRALGVLPPSASPTDIYPSIGFNSAFPFDFDRSDGVGSGQVDFESVALHELGHVLAYSSMVGSTEISTGLPLSVSVLDIFRTGPGTTVATFGSVQRLQTSGGTHMFFNGFFESGLSTGRNDGTGGDGNQPGHWKDDGLTGFIVGVMDPSLPQQTVAFLTIDDLLGLDVMGYAIAYPPAPAAPTNLTGLATSTSTLDLSWADNATNESEFRLEWVASGAWRELGGVPANRTRVSLRFLTPGTTYRFRIIATNAGGYSAYSNEATVTTSPDCVPPSITSQPPSPTVSFNQSATLSVQASGTAPVSYQWYQGNVGTGSVINGATSTTYTTPSLAATTTFWVKASNGCGSANSIAAVVSVSTSPPSSPTQLRYSGRTVDRVNLFWTHDGANVTGFRYYYSLDGASFLPFGSLAQPTQRSASITSMVPGSAYFFRVTAVNSAGESSASNTVQVPIFTPPRHRAVK